MAMKLNEALRAVAAARGLPIRHHLFLACGFEPLHLPVFLQAHYLARFPGSELGVISGLYGDLEGNIDRALQSEATAAAVVLEWSDLDSRLGLRSTGPWGVARQEEILADVAGRLDRLHRAIAQLVQRMPVVVAAPAISFTLAGSTTGWQIGGFELALDQMVAGFLVALAESPRVAVLHPQRLAARSPLGSRHDPRMELAAGFPFRTEHASALAEGLLALAFPLPPRKGLITDLDDTLWAGLVGEVGADSLSWSQADGAQMHGLYQSMLRQLHEMGVLLAVASKNEADAVDAALARPDLLIDRNAFFPVEVGWGPKSAAVAAILRAWNVSADAVVFVDDSRMELEEVRGAHPGITCLQFPQPDPGASLRVLEHLRDQFGKTEVSDEDRQRSASIRAMASFEAERAQAGAGEERAERAGRDIGRFLAGLDGKVGFDRAKNPDDRRLLELINKTNQFNLNGERVAEGEWLAFLAREESFAAGVSYADRYGALGTIGVVAGYVAAEGVEVVHWVLSCRAFSRKIEHHMLLHLFESSGRDRARLRYRRTERNRPLQEFLRQLGAAPDEDREVVVSRGMVDAVARDLPHRVIGARP
jgi:FkbH-like protein